MNLLSFKNHIRVLALFLMCLFAPMAFAQQPPQPCHITITGGTVHGHGDESCCGNWTGAMGAFHKDHRDNDWQDCKSGKYGWQRIYTGKCMRLHTWTAYNGYWEHVSYTANWWDYVHGRSEVIFEECNHVDGAYDITNCPYCHSYTLTLE